MHAMHARNGLSLLGGILHHAPRSGRCRGAGMRVLWPEAVEGEKGPPSLPSLVGAGKLICALGARPSTCAIRRRCEGKGEQITTPPVFRDLGISSVNRSIRLYTTHLYIHHHAKAGISTPSTSSKTSTPSPSPPHPPYS